MAGDATNAATSADRPAAAMMDLSRMWNSLEACCNYLRNDYDRRVPPVASGFVIVCRAFNKGMNRTVYFLCL